MLILCRTPLGSPEQIKRISSHPDNWDNISFDDWYKVADVLINVIKVIEEAFIHA